MGFSKNWNKHEIERQLFSIHHACTNPYNDGYTGFLAKKDLLELKFLIEDLLENTPIFVGENEIYEHRLLKKLKQ